MVCPPKNGPMHIFFQKEIPQAWDKKGIILFFLSNCKEGIVAKQLLLLFEAPLNVPVREKPGFTNV